MERTGSSPASLRDEGLLESAMMRPRYVALYENADLIRQAVSLAVGISQAQAFMDGNRQTAFAACDVFLRLNGFMYTGEPIELAQQLETIAQSKDSRGASIDQFESWLRGHITKME